MATENGDLRSWEQCGDQVPHEEHDHLMDGWLYRCDGRKASGPEYPFKEGDSNPLPDPELSDDEWIAALSGEIEEARREQ
jgi:hypothetical protein